MKTRQKDSEIFTSDSLHFKQNIKASQSEIMKDFLQINESVPVFKKIPQVDSDPRKLQKVLNIQRTRKAKTRITEDISPVLGLATLINEMDSGQLTIFQKKPKPAKPQNAKKLPKVTKCNQAIKLIGYSRAETHLGIARFISQKLRRN
jgi:hypothetical protein